MKKTALITGASGGLGLEFAKIFAKKGYNLVLVARNERKLLKLKRKLEKACHIRAAVFPKDLSEKDAAKDVYNFTLKQKIRVDVLVNNAGFGDFGMFSDSDWQKQYEMLQVNITALMQLTHCYLKQMTERGSGRILNVASVAAFEPGPLMSVYYATKACVLSFTEALSVELEGTGVTVTALCPGPTKTGFEDRASLGESGLFKNLKSQSAKRVARFGYRKLIRGKVIAVPGMQNKLTAAAVRVAPRKAVRKIVYQIQK